MGEEGTLRKGQPRIGKEKEIKGKDHERNERKGREQKIRCDTRNEGWKKDDWFKKRKDG